MAEGSKWTPGKIFLLVVGILGGLALICCGIGWLLIGDKIVAGMHFASDTADFAQRLQKDVGANTTFDIVADDPADMALAIGVTGELTPERITEVQDLAWKALGAAYGDHGFFPVKRLGVGAGKAGKKGKGSVSGWSAHTIAVDDIVKRTGVAAPPLVKFLPENFGNDDSDVHVTFGGSTKEGNGGDGK